MGVIYKNDIPYSGGSGGGTGGTSDYTQLSNKPSINNTTLANGQTLDDLNIVDDVTIKVDSNHKLALKNTPHLEGSVLVI